MAGKTNDAYTAEGGLALCRALQAVGRDPEAAAKAIAEAEVHFKAVLNRNQSAEPKQPAAKKGQNQ